MTIDIDRLTEAELIDLNRRIVERLRLLQQMRAHKQSWSSGSGTGSPSRRTDVAPWRAC